MGSATITAKNTEATHLIAYSIKLPFPSAIDVGTNYSWAADDMGVAADIVKQYNQGGVLAIDIQANIDRASAVIANAVGGSANSQANHLAKKALNPKNEMLFKGVEHRQFSLSWDLVPTSRAESIAYATAIEKLHEMAAPTLLDGEAFFKYPDTTKIVVQKSGGLEIINRPNSAITSINVQLTPDGIWSQLADGRPVHTVLTIEFIELDLPTKDNVPKLLG